MPSTFTYDDHSRREDLLDIITNLDYKEFQLVSGLGTSEAKDILHQWVTDTLKTVAVNAAVEGAAASFVTRTNPARVTNYTQIVKIDYSVSDTNRETNNAGFEDRYAYEMTKAMKEFKQDLEYALMRGSLVTGSGSVGRNLRGIKNSLNNVTSQSGVSLTETILNDYFQNVWDDGTEVNAIYAPMYLKRKISSFTGGATKNVTVDDRRLIAAVDVYQADAAKNVKLFAHRFVRIATDTNYDLVGINEDYFKIAWLRKPKNVELAKVGDSTDAQVIGEATLECLHGDAGFWARAHL